MGNSLEKTRLSLHKTLLDILGSEISLYYQPPESIKLKYPCVIYNLNNEDILYSDDVAYFKVYGFSCILIDYDPASEYFDKLNSIEYSHFDRFYIADNLNHWSFDLSCITKED